MTRKTTVDLSVLHISGHAAERFCQRVMHKDPRSYYWRSRSVGRLSHELRRAQPMAAVADHHGRSQHAWRLASCVAIEIDGIVTTVITHDQARNGILGGRA